MKILGYTAIFVIFSSTLFFSDISLSQGVKTLTECIPTKKSNQFSCKVMISDGTEPVVDKEIVVSAMMPSMPMAHNVKPAKLKMLNGMEGHYEFIIELEMLGEWMFSYDLQKPEKIRSIEKIIFDPEDNMINTTHSHDHKGSHK